ncbi:hypothetical protein V5N11_009243 [Cardamine amara subsp. amara]|uniref:Uncharacterized protein n=1 Tax=Cardamine amara subsp. amara TaxID=228776 RepID=A0ABD1BUM5_CARAN
MNNIQRLWVGSDPDLLCEARIYWSNSDVSPNALLPGQKETRLVKRINTWRRIIARKIFSRAPRGEYSVHISSPSSNFQWFLLEVAQLREKQRMAMPLEMAMLLTKTVWFALSGWIFTCLSIADEIAGSLRNREIDIFHVG